MFIKKLLGIGDDEKHVPQDLGFKKGKLYTTSITDLINRVLNLPCSHSTCCRRGCNKSCRIQTVCNRYRARNQAGCCPCHTCVIPEFAPCPLRVPYPGNCVYRPPPPPPPPCYVRMPSCRPCINIAMAPCCHPNQRCSSCPQCCPCPCPCPCPGRCRCPCNCRCGCQCPSYTLPIIDRPFRGPCPQMPHRRGSCGCGCGCGPCWRRPRPSCGYSRGGCGYGCDCDCDSNCDCGCHGCCDNPAMYNNCNFYSTPMRCYNSDAPLVRKPNKDSSSSPN